tara:strand:- start:247 stop:492 length:246 start_codon:yes stop_codon:yes gene_type:complete
MLGKKMNYKFTAIIVLLFVLFTFLVSDKKETNYFWFIPDVDLDKKIEKQKQVDSNLTETEKKMVDKATEKEWEEVDKETDK